MTGIVTVYAVFANGEEARAICRAVVEEGLAACGNILAPCQSVYRWKGAIETSEEVPALLKTGAEQAEALIARIAVLHSYEVPAAVVWPIETAHPAYSSWVEDVTTRLENGGRTAG